MDSALDRLLLLFFRFIVALTVKVALVCQTVGKRKILAALGGTIIIIAPLPRFYTASLQ